MPDAPWIQNLANQVNQQFGTNMTPGDIWAGGPLSLGVARGQVAPNELAQLYSGRLTNPGVPQFDPTQPTAQMMQQAGMAAPPGTPALPAAGQTITGSATGYRGPTPTQIIPSTNGPFEAGPAGSTGVAPGTALDIYRGGVPDLASTSATAASSAAPATAAAGELASTKAATQSLADVAAKEVATSATSDAAAAASGVAVAGRGAKLFEALNTRINGLVPGLGAEISAGSLVSGLGVATLGLAASGMLDRMNIGGENSNWDIGLSKGLAGASVFGGLGIALGLSAGPVGWAALAGAGLFAVTGILTHKSEQDKANKMMGRSSQIIDNLINDPSFGVDSFTATQIRGQFAASTSFFKAQKDWKGLETYLQGLASTVPTFLLQASERNQAVQQRMKLQAAFGPVYANMMSRSADANRLAFDTQMKAASQVSDPNLAASLKDRASTQFASQQALQAAYAQQVAGYTTQLPAPAQQVQSQAQQAVSQMMAQTGR